MRQKNPPTLESAIQDVVNYFNYFSYPPTMQEIYTFLSIKTSKAKLKSEIEAMIDRNRLKELKDPKILNTKLVLSKVERYLIPFGFAQGELDTKNTIPPYRIRVKQIEEKRTIAKAKQECCRQYIEILKKLPFVQLVGLSGSCAMEYCEEKDDIDLFIITSKKRMWTARFVAVVVATFLGVRRNRGSDSAPDKVCLNLFFDEHDMLVPKHKQNLYTAHEVLQMKPLFAKGDIYERFLKVNEWIYHYFPNSSHDIPAKTGIYSNRFLYMKIGDKIELVLKKLQLLLVNRHKTTEIITPTQLWFFPKDFEKRLKQKKLI